MNEKRYLLTHDEICQLQDIALSALAWESEDNDEMVELKQARCTQCHSWGAGPKMDRSVERQQAKAAEAWNTRCGAKVVGE